MQVPSFSARFLMTVVLPFLLAVRSAGAVEPGVDIAVPRVAISVADDTITFKPANIAVEQGDYVRWKWGGPSFSHTTTSGPNCGPADNLWNAALNSLSPLFTFQFTKPPGPYPYFCSIVGHCSSFNMKGLITVTGGISLTADDVAGMLTLTWTGGGTAFRVFRSDNPAFTGPRTVVLTPATGTTQSTLTDVLQPPVGQVAFYLVMDWFATTQF